MPVFAFIKNILGWIKNADPPVVVSKVIVGIGNTGKEYQQTRHNVGFMAADLLIGRFEKVSSVKLRYSSVFLCKIKDGSIVAIAKPLTFVNKSGLAIRELLDRYGVSPEHCLVVLDDLNIVLGVVRVRAQGSAGGHNGLKSIIAEIGEVFPRIRIGIGPVPASVRTVDFVLSNFSSEEGAVINKAIETACKVVSEYCEHGIINTTNSYNVSSGAF